MKNAEHGLEPKWTDNIKRDIMHNIFTYFLYYLFVQVSSED